jgi:hypothetical protein
MANETNYSDTLMANGTNYSDTMLDLCPIYTDMENHIINEVAFWLDGVTTSIVAILGVMSNILACCILTRPKMKNSFNLCLVALASIDTIYLLATILESCRKRSAISHYTYHVQLMSMCGVLC